MDVEHGLVILMLAVLLPLAPQLTDLLRHLLGHWLPVVERLLEPPAWLSEWAARDPERQRSGTLEDELTLPEDFFGVKEPIVEPEPAPVELPALRGVAPEGEPRTVTAYDFRATDDATTRKVIDEWARKSFLGNLDDNRARYIADELRKLSLVLGPIADPIAGQVCAAASQGYDRRAAN